MASVGPDNPTGCVSEVEMYEAKASRGRLLQPTMATGTTWEVVISTFCEECLMLGSMASIIAYN